MGLTCCTHVGNRTRVFRVTNQRCNHQATLLSQNDLRQPENMTCVLHKKRLLTCTYDVHDGVDRNKTTCTICQQFSKVDTCDDVLGKRCNTSVGKCEYNCDNLKFCDLFHTMKITVEGRKGDISASMCRQIKTKDYIQPGPVRDLRMTAINSTALRVSWKQPDDRLRLLDQMMYRYSVTYFTTVRKVKKTRSRDEDLEVVLSDLKPWTSYTVTVRSRPHTKGFLGPPQNTTSSTLEDVPLSGPHIPRNLYSRVAPGVLEIYWSSVSQEARNGIIVNYSVHASCCLSQPLYTTDHSSTVNITGHSYVTVRVNAATKIGWSKHPSKLRVDKRDLDVQYIERVQRSDAMLVWVSRDNADKQPDFFIVSRCFGSQDDKMFQLVKCRGQVNTRRVLGNESALLLEDHLPPKLACAGCDWQYAVSAGVDGVTSPMVWNTPLQHFETRSITTITNDWPSITALVTGVVAAVGVAVAVVVVKRNVLCERFKIQMPQLMWSISDKEDPCAITDEDDRSGNNKGHQGTPQVVAITIDVLEEDGERAALPEEQLLPAGMQAERDHVESDKNFFLTESVGSNYNQVTIDTGKSTTQDCLPCNRDRSASYDSTRKLLIDGAGPGRKTGSLFISNDFSDEVRESLCPGDHIHQEVFCERVGSLGGDEGWSSSSDSGVSTYRQVPEGSGLSQSPEDCQPDESATTVSAVELEEGHDSAHSSTSHIMMKPLSVSEQLQVSSSYSPLTVLSSATAPHAPCQITTSSTEVKLHPCHQRHSDFHQSVPPPGNGT